MPGYPDWAGTPLVTGDIVILNVTNQVLGPFAQYSVTLPVIRTAYMLKLELWNATDHVTKLPVSVELLWGDNQTLSFVDRQDWWMFAGDSAAHHIIRGHGPTVGDSLSFNIVNQQGGAVNLEFNLVVLESTRQLQLHDLRTDVHANPLITGWTLAPSDVQAGIVLAEQSLAVGAGGNVIQIMPLFAGEVTNKFSSTGAGGVMQQAINAVSDTILTPPVQISYEVTNASSLIISELRLPRAQCEIIISNTSGAAIAVSGSLVADNV
jgi:hypothetical protein